MVNSRCWYQGTCISRTFLAFSDQNRTLKKNHKAGQCLTTRGWFVLDYSLPHYQIGSWAIVFPSSFMINFRLVNIWPTHQSLDQRIWLTILFCCFFISKWVALCSKYWFFKLNYDLFCSNWSYQRQNYQNVPQVFYGKL